MSLGDCNVTQMKFSAGLDLAFGSTNMEGVLSDGLVVPTIFFTEGCKVGL